MEYYQIPPIAFGQLPVYFNTRRFSLAGLNRRFHFTPRIAAPYQSTYIDRGCSTVNINSGYASGPADHVGEYTALQRNNRSVFLGPEYIQDSNGGKHFSDFTLSDARNAANYAWNRANGYGVVTSGAQEGRYDNDPFATYAGAGRDDAFKNLAQAWGEIMTANPGFLYYGNYDGIFYFNTADKNPNTLRTALSSNANALAYMKANEYGPNPYFRLEIWRHHPPLLNLYFRSLTNVHDKAWEVRMAIKLTKMALAAVGASWPVMGFVFPGKTESVSYRGQGYSEKHVQQLRDDTYMETYTFPDYSHQFQFTQTFTILDKADDYYGWEDTQLAGTNPLIAPNDIIRGDNFPIVKVYGNLSGLTRVPAYGKTPYDPTATYAYPLIGEGHTDIAPIGAETYADAARFGGQNSQLTRTRRTNTSTWNSQNSGSEVDRHENREPFTDFARTGNNGWWAVTDYVTEPTGPYSMDIEVGSGQYITVQVEPQQTTAGTFTQSDLKTY